MTHPMAALREMVTQVMTEGRRNQTIGFGGQGQAEIEWDQSSSQPEVLTTQTAPVVAWFGHG
jgi:hypothetical protein